MSRSNARRGHARRRKIALGDELRSYQGVHLVVQTDPMMRHVARLDKILRDEGLSYRDVYLVARGIELWLIDVGIWPEGVTDPDGQKRRAHHPRFAH